MGTVTDSVAQSKYGTVQVVCPQEEKKDMIEDSKIVMVNRITLEFVQKYVNEFTKCNCMVIETPKSVLVHIIVNRDFQMFYDFKRLTYNLKLLMPAHLELTYENRIKQEFLQQANLAKIILTDEGGNTMAVENLKLKKQLALHDGAIADLGMVVSDIAEGGI